MHTTPTAVVCLPLYCEQLAGPFSDISVAGRPKSLQTACCRSTKRYILDITCAVLTGRICLLLSMLELPEAGMVRSARRLGKIMLRVSGDSLNININGS